MSDTGDKKRVLVFGGVFDPVHNGHISAAQAALEQCGAVKAVFLPERTPYRKQECSPYEHRVQMLKLATQNNPKLTVHDFPDAKQTIANVFAWLNESYPDHTYSWLVGNDVIHLLISWPGSERLRSFGVDEIIVAQRDNEFSAKGTIPDEIVGIKTKQLKAPNSEISSSVIRSDKTAAEAHLPQAVYRYALKNHLYWQ